MSTDTLENIKVDEKVETTDSGDHDTFKHYAHVDQVSKSMLDGSPVVAICGKVWVPTKDFTKYPTCPTCKEIYETREP